MVNFNKQTGFKGYVVSFWYARHFKAKISDNSKFRCDADIQNDKMTEHGLVSDRC